MIKTTVNTIVIDKNYRKLLNRNNNLSGTKTKIGLVEGNPLQPPSIKGNQNFRLFHRVVSKSIAELSEIFFFNEFGTDKIPSRPALRNSFDNNIPGMVKTIEYNINRYLFGKINKQTLLNNVGKFIKKLQKDTIINFKIPENAEFTISNKGFNDPLMDTGQLVNNIGYKHDTK